MINLEKYIKNRKCTLLGVGPMSLNCIDATIELAEEHKSPLMMIASRRQIDSKQFGGGYVNNWNSENLSQYLKKMISIQIYYYPEITEGHIKII